MSLNKTLDRLFDEIRREVKRNPDFADRLDSVLRLHESRRDVADAVIEEVATERRTVGVSPAEAAQPSGKPASETLAVQAKPAKPAPKAAAGRRMLELLNPVGLYKREGEDALAAMLTKANTETLRALIVEHNLDPSGETEGLDHDALAAHVIAQAKRRAERDEKMFDY